MSEAEDEAEQLEGDRKTVEALIAHGDPLTMDPPFQNSPTRLLQNSPTQLFSVDHS